MRPPVNRRQRLYSTLLQHAASELPGLRVVLHATLGVEANGDPFAQVPAAVLEDPDRLRLVPGMPGGTLLVMDAARIPAELLPPAAPPDLSLALLACSGMRLYDPRRPVVPTRARLIRSIVLLQPHRYHDTD